MKFSKFNQPNNRKGGRKPSQATIAKRNAEIEEERDRQQLAEAVAFEKFCKAENGYFNGFEFSELFHRHYNKAYALYTGKSNDIAEVSTPFGAFHVGNDNITVYFFSKEPKKWVSFNRSVYAI